MTGLSYSDTISWREQVMEALPEDIVAISPLRGYAYMKGSRKINPEEFLTHPLGRDAAIAARDKLDVSRCDVILTNFLGADQVSIGTVMEIAWADAMAKPHLMVIEDTNNIHDHPMIRACTGFRVSTLDDAISVLKSMSEESTHAEAACGMVGSKGINRQQIYQEVKQRSQELQS